MLGFPIRTSADRGPVDGSPQLFAVTHVLHRFLAPRHPPLALISLERTSYLVHWAVRRLPEKMLVLALQFSRSHRTAVPAAYSNGLEDATSSTLGCEGQLPQNGREDGDRRCTCRREGPNPCDRRSLRRQSTSAPTGVSRTRIERNVDHRVERHSLERR